MAQVFADDVNVGLHARFVPILNYPFLDRSHGFKVPSFLLARCHDHRRHPLLHYRSADAYKPGFPGFLKPVSIWV